MSDYNSWNWPNRTVCATLEEMRNLDKTRNYSALPGLIEEAQTMVNRMEAALGDGNNIVEMKKERTKLKAEIRKLQAEAKKGKKK